MVGPRRCWRPRVVAILTTVFLSDSTTTLCAAEAAATTGDLNKWYMLVNGNSGKAVATQGASTTDGGQVVEYADGGGRNQQGQRVAVADIGDGSGALPSAFRWGSSGVRDVPKPGARRNAVSVNDSSAVRHNVRWLICATASSSSGEGLVTHTFADWPQSAAAPHTCLDPDIGQGELVRVGNGQNSTINALQPAVRPPGPGPELRRRLPAAPVWHGPALPDQLDLLRSHP
ncbi:hypothetical protein P8605_00255 [Streptomyces sp. T-3]|nr:hypothetical protein [Streptomyces sp. T-3]